MFDVDLRFLTALLSGGLIWISAAASLSATRLEGNLDDVDDLCLTERGDLKVPLSFSPRDLDLRFGEGGGGGRSSSESATTTGGGRGAVKDTFGVVADTSPDPPNRTVQNLWGPCSGEAIWVVGPMLSSIILLAPNWGRELKLLSRAEPREVLLAAAIAAEDVFPVAILQMKTFLLTLLLEDMEVGAVLEEEAEATEALLEAT